VEFRLVGGLVDETLDPEVPREVGSFSIEQLLLLCCVSSFGEEFDGVVGEELFPHLGLEFWDDDGGTRDLSAREEGKRDGGFGGEMKGEGDRIGEEPGGVDGHVGWR